jgi:hypothetical protein
LDIHLLDEMEALAALGRAKAVEKEILEPVRARFLNGLKAERFDAIAAH